MGRRDEWWRYVPKLGVGEEGTGEGMGGSRKLGASGATDGDESRLRWRKVDWGLRWMGWDGMGWRSGRKMGWSVAVGDCRDRVEEDGGYGYSCARTELLLRRERCENAWLPSLCGAVLCWFLANVRTPSALRNLDFRRTRK